MSFFLLMVAFTLTGILNVSNKALVEWGYGDQRDLYLFGFYGIPMLIGTTVMLFSKQKTKPTDRWVGLLMGIAGGLNMLFFLIALQHMPGIVAFPIRNMGNLVLTALVSIITWRERLSLSQWVGIAFSLIAIWLIY